jgi:uncharacterized protein (DUF2062 family)
MSNMARSFSLRRWFRRLEPRVLASLKGPLFDRIKPWLDRRDVFNFNRRPLALGVAFGMFCGLIPGPLQVFGTLILCAYFRGNVIAGAVATVFTNPLTIVPLYLLAFQIGQYFLPGHHLLAPAPAFSWHSTEWMAQVSQWVQSMGWPLLLGLPLLALSLSLLSWVIAQGLCLAPVLKRLMRMRRYKSAAGRQTP